MRNRENILKGLQLIVSALSQQAEGHLIQSRIFAAQGFSKLADKYAEHVEEERGYVKQCIDRIIDLGGEVKLEAKAEMPICKDPIEFIKYDLQVSRDGVEALAAMVEEAREDYKTFDILKAYYQDEEEDMYWSENQLELIECIGRKNWLAGQL